MLILDPKNVFLIFRNLNPLTSSLLFRLAVAILCVITSGIFFQIFVAFTENLNLNNVYFGSRKITLKFAFLDFGPLLSILERYIMAKIVYFFILQYL
jgi:hypothetical protein